MKIVLIAFLISTLHSFNQNDNKSDNILDKAINKTWFFQDEFAGSSITIYKTKNGLIRGIRQIHGSGVPVLATEFYDIEIISNKIRMHSVTNAQVEKTLILSYENRLKRGKFLGRQINENVEIWSWIKGRKMSRIDFEKLKSIEVSKGEFYHTIQIKNIELEE